MRTLPPSVGVTRARARMERALEIARSHTPAGDVPIAAVVFDAEGRELAWATNRREADSDPTAHAEILALRQAALVHGDGWRLTGCEIVVTVEPCAMCAGAILHSRVHSLVFGAFEPKTGACGSVIDILRDSPTSSCEVRGGVLEAQAASLVREFFIEMR